MNETVVYRARIVVDIEFTSGDEGRDSLHDYEGFARTLTVDGETLLSETSDSTLLMRIDHLETHFTSSLIDLYTSLALVEPLVLLEEDGYRRALTRESALEATKARAAQTLRKRLPVNESTKAYKHAHSFFFRCLRHLDELEAEGNLEPIQRDLADKMFTNETSPDGGHSNPAKELSSRFKTYGFSFDELVAMRNAMKETGQTLDEENHFFDPNTIFSVLRKWLRQTPT